MRLRDKIELMRMRIVSGGKVDGAMDLSFVEEEEDEDEDDEEEELGCGMNL